MERIWKLQIKFKTFSYLCLDTKIGLFTKPDESWIKEIKWTFAIFIGPLFFNNKPAFFQIVQEWPPFLSVINETDEVLKTNIFGMLVIL